MIENEPVVARGGLKKNKNKNTRRERKKREGSERCGNRKKKGGVGGEREGRPQGGREEIDASKGG